jgi:hypothetical protein
MQRISKEKDPLFWAAQCHTNKIIFESAIAKPTRTFNEMDAHTQLILELNKLPCNENIDNNLLPSTFAKSVVSKSFTRQSVNDSTDIELYQCDICYDSFEVNNVWTQCSNLRYIYPRNGFCKNCVESYIRIQILESNINNRGEIKCCCGVTSCSFCFTRSHMMTMLEHDDILLQKYYEFSNNVYILTNKNIVFCPYPSCSAVVDISNSRSKIVKCQKCNQSFCKMCKNVHSAFVACSMVSLFITLLFLLL